LEVKQKAKQFVRQHRVSGAEPREESIVSVADAIQAQMQGEKQ
jgi:hypothetical protein